MIGYLIYRTIFTKDRVNDVSAYKKHAAGEILIKIRNDEVLTAMPRYHCRDDRSYLVHGGLGGLGLELGIYIITILYFLGKTIHDHNILM